MIEKKDGKMKYGLGFLCRAVCFAMVCFCTTALYAAPATPSSETIYILLGTSRDGQDTSDWRGTGIKSYIQNSVLGAAGDTSLVYESSYDLSMGTPADFAREFLSRSSTTSILDSAQRKWFAESKASAVVKLRSKYSNNLSSLKNARPDLVPSHFVIIADGASGLAVREYIQGPDYQGEISNVIFFNTPHEGMGLADQGVFNHTKKLDRDSDKSKYAMLVTLALAAYIVGGTEGLQDMMIGLLKDAVMGMAYNVGAISGGVSNLYGGYAADQASSWYLAQDADEDDPKYKDLVKTNGADSLLGSTQILNLGSVRGGYAHPRYNVVYSYGLPTVGNGRRTLDDFAERSKFHVSKKKLARVLADSLRSAFGASAQENLDGLAADILENNNVQAALANYSQYSGKVADAARALAAVSELRRDGLNKDDIPGTVYKLLRIVDTFVPDSYKSEIYSLLMKYFSPEVQDVIGNVGKCAIGGGSASACARKGMSLMAANLANYSLNFFDEGTFDVPYYSAMGENVAAFKSAGAERHGYSLQDLLDTKNLDRSKFTAYSSALGELDEYNDLLSDVGELETDRLAVDLALNVACEVITRANAAYGKICSAAEFATNVALVGLTSSKVKKLASTSDALKVSRKMAPMASVSHENTYSGKDYHGNDFSGSVPDIEDMLFGYPLLSIATVRNVNAKGDTVAVPLISKNECSAGDVYDWSAFDSLCGDPGWMTMGLLDFSEDAGTLHAAQEDIRVKDVAYGADGVARAKYAPLRNLSIDNVPKEIRFQVDDLQPDSLRWIKIDFNTRNQIIYERDTSGQWFVYFEESYKAGVPVDTLSASPVTPEGLFVFRPEAVIKAHNATGGPSYGIAGLVEDGVNVFYFAVMNKVGKVSSSKLSMMCTTTGIQPYELWPMNLARVSRLDTVSASVNNKSYEHLSLVSARLKVSKINDDGGASDSLIASVALDSAYQTPEATSEKWNVSADVGPFVAGFGSHSDGEYMLEWDFDLHDAISGKTDTLKMRTLVYLDVTPPALSLDLHKEMLTGRKSDGAWATVVSPDSGYEAVRGMRGMLVDGLGNVFSLFNKTRHNARYFDIRWDTTRVAPSPGRYWLVVQAYDFADPDTVSRNRLLNIKDSDTIAWRFVAVSDSVFKPGFNGTVLRNMVWIDNAAPSVVSSSIVMSSVRDTTASGCDSSRITRTGFVLNSCNLLSTSFRVNEKLFGRVTSPVKVEIVFKDSTEYVRTYPGALEVDTAVSDFAFVEPYANKLRDGVYSVYAVMSDLAGNVSETKIASKVVVDRTAPAVYDVSSDGGAFDSAAVLIGKEMSALVSQNVDDPRNVSTLSCVRSLNAAGVSSGWKIADSLTFALGTVERRLPFSIGDLVQGMPNGSWTVYIGCYDAAGNFGSGLDFFGVGARYPRITYPDTSLNSFYYGKVMVKGETPNPVLIGNDNMVSFKLAWKADGDTAWHDDDKDFEYLAYGAGAKERDLAIWTLDSVPSGDDTLKLSVRACDTCAWVSSKTVVTVYSKLDPLHDTTETDIRIAVPSVQPLGGPGSVAIELEHVSDTTAWEVDSRIFMRIIGDTTVVEASRKSFNPATVSPFKMVPTTIDSGLYVWQDSSYAWHVYWKGSVKGAVVDTAYLRQKRDSVAPVPVPNSVERTAPRLTLRYLADSTNTTLSDSLFSLAARDTGAMGSVEAGGILVPAYDRSATWALDSLGDDSLHLVFASGSAFTVDVSTVDSAYRNVYCGNRTADEALPDYGGVGTIYVHPHRYTMYHVWSGLNGGGIIADGDSAYVKVIAYSKNDPSRIVTKEVGWELAHDKIKLVSGTAPGGELYFNIEFNNIADSTPVKREEIMFQYGLFGRSAYVTEEVIGPNGFVKLIKELKLVHAGASNTANSVSWNGEDGQGLVTSGLGTYKFRITAYSDAAGTKLADVLEYPFELKSRENLQEAPFVASDSVNYPAVLTMDEAHLDSFGGLRYVGSIDYLMKAHAELNRLPEEDRTINYKWVPWTGNNGTAMQAPAFYERFPYSVGIHRHRDKFPVTVAVLLVTKGFDVEEKLDKKKATFDVLTGLWSGDYYYCSKGSVKYPYRIQLLQATMSESGTISYSGDIKLDSDLDIVGYSSNDPSDISMGVAVKVLPADVYSSIKKSMQIDTNFVIGHAENELASGKTIEGLNSVWNKDLFVEGENISLWFNNWDGKPVLWESKIDSFFYYKKSIRMSSKSSSGSSPCTVDTTVKNSVCSISYETESNPDSLKKALDIDNPHANMMYVDVLTMPGESDYGIDTFSTSNACSKYNGSYSDIGIHLSFAVTPAYWNPALDPNKKWGYTNLANRYVRFDPTNIKLFGDGGYFKTNQDDGGEMNYFGSKGWEYHYDTLGARISAFEAMRYPMSKSPMNPLIFSDEINIADEDSLSLSNFSITYFDAGVYPKFRTVASNSNGTVNMKTVDNTDPGAMSENWLDSVCRYKPLNVSFTVAPVMTVGEAIIQSENNFWLDYPFTGVLSDTLLKRDPNYGAQPSRYVFYTDYRSRVHTGVGDWDDDNWDSVYVINDTIRNPVTDPSVYSHPLDMVASSRNYMDSVYSYSVKPSDTVAGVWSAHPDSLLQSPVGHFHHGKGGPIIHGNLKLIVVDSLGNPLPNTRWIAYPSGSLWGMTNVGDSLLLPLRYVFSADSSVAMNMNTREHSVPLANVFRQNSLDTVLGDTWVKNLSVRLDSIVERDTALVDTALRKHGLLDAAYNDATRFFNVVWNGMAPTSRAYEIVTFRGRVPGANAPWKLSYVHDGYTYPIASGVQDTVPITEPFPVLKRFNMSHLNGDASFFLTWGSGDIMHYRELDLRVGTRVEPDSFAYVQSAYANAGVEFAAHAWGDVPVDVNVRSVAPDEYVFKTFKGLAVQGPVVEVLPSHDFGDVASLWPVVKVKLSHDDVRNSGYNLDELKIYKPDFENREIVPLENVSYECFVEVSGGVDTQDSCSNTTWDYVFLKGTTRTFSTFVVLDTLTAKSVVPVGPPSVPDTLICAEPASDTVWAGTYNGRLEFANPCTGRGNYLLQLRVGGSVAAEHQGVLSGPAIAWEVRRGDIWLPADVYTSRADYYGVDGSTERVRGPMVRVDSMPPSLTDFDVSVLDGDSGSRVLLISASLADSISGIANVVMDVRFGGYLAETRTLSLGSIADTALYEQFVLSPVLLHHCTGCRATVDVRIEDMGHNYVEESWRSRQLYPFPSSLALWYPMSEGAGSYAYEILGTQVQLRLGPVVSHWVYGGRITFSDSGDYARPTGRIYSDSATPMSVEFNGIVGELDGLVFTWVEDVDTLKLGVRKGLLYVDAGSGPVSFTPLLGTGASARYVFVFDSSNVSLYVDGNFVERKVLPGGFVMRGSGMPVLGSLNRNQFAAYFRMSDLRIYRSALTAEQVQFLENLDSLPPYREPGDTSAVDTSVVDSTPVQLAIRAVELDSVSGLVVDQSCALPGRSYLRQGSGTSGMAVWNVDAPRAGNYALYVFGRGYPSGNSRVEVSVNGVNVGTYGLRPSGLWESSRMGDSLLFALDSGMNRIALRPLGGAELAGVAAISGPILPEAHLVDYGQSGWAAPEPSVEAFIYYENAYETTWARPRIKLHNLTGQYIYGARIRYYYSGEGSAVAAESWYPKGPVSLVHDAGDVYYAEYALAEPIPPHGYANNGSAIQIGLHRTPDYKPWKIQDDPSYEHGSAYGYVEAKGVVVLDSKGVMLNGWNCVDDGMPATTPASGIRALAAEESNEPWKNSTIAVYVENNGFDSISGFEARYYYRDASGTMEYPDWYYLGPENKAAAASRVSAGGNLYYVSLVYNNVVLKPGKRTAAVKFGLHAQGWSESAYSVSDDPSHHGIGTGKNLLEADSVVVLDRNGNLLWGGVPRPNFQNNVVASDSGANRVTRVGDMVYVNIDQTGYYYLEVVDAFGTVKNRIFEGTWNVGEHTVQIPASAMKAGRYIVLRRGNTILNWQLLK